MPCYAGLGVTEQVKIFEPSPFGVRKIIVSTNVAESSITLPNVEFVVDSCLTKVKVYDSAINCEQLLVVAAS